MDFGYAVVMPPTLIAPPHNATKEWSPLAAHEIEYLRLTERGNAKIGRLIATLDRAADIVVTQHESLSGVVALAAELVEAAHSDQQPALRARLAKVTSALRPEQPSAIPPPACAPNTPA